MNTLSTRALISLLLAGTIVMQAQSPAELRVIVVSGEGAVNNIRRKLMTPVEVEVRDERDRPVEGARVRFSLPTLGPGGRFADGSRSTEALTDARGRAGFSSFVPNEQEGRFSMVVDAVSKGREGGASVSQMNSLYLTAAPSRGAEMLPARHRGTRTLAIVLGVGLAAATGGMLAIRGGGAKPGATAATAPVGISLGGVSVGGPQ